ncbi:hypothetical protein H0H81_001048 [Sphagnurus paluster]|uniref:Uncharacterized protein n=1 Tax=Sphagnurus paluster TaxID=117069 RepID=A0A9P7KF90_9AGAR|nr:hypothetical protein H0H81_001048 [Sphagnurus paluster]
MEVITYIVSSLLRFLGMASEPEPPPSLPEEFSLLRRQVYDGVMPVAHWKYTLEDYCCTNRPGSDVMRERLNDQRILEIRRLRTKEILGGTRWLNEKGDVPSTTKPPDGREGVEEDLRECIRNAAQYLWYIGAFRDLIANRATVSPLQEAMKKRLAQNDIRRAVAVIPADLALDGRPRGASRARVLR